MNDCMNAIVDYAASFQVFQVAINVFASLDLVDQGLNIVGSLIPGEKLSSSWLHYLPGPNGPIDIELDNTEFSEAMALTLCMPIPDCQERVGDISSCTKDIDQRMLTTPSGAFEEASDDQISSVGSDTEKSIIVNQIKIKRTVSDNENGVTVNQIKIKRTLSLSVIKSQMGGFMSKIHHASTNNLAKKKERSLSDEKMKQERTAQWISRIEGNRNMKKRSTKAP